VKRSPFERPRILPPAFAAPRKFVPMMPAPRTPVARPSAPVTPRKFVPVQPTPLRAPRNPVAPPPAAAIPSVSTKLTIVTVKPGDSLWKFAAERLGNGRRWQELLSINPGLRDPNRIEAGSQLVLPASVSPTRTATKYTVRQGDTLSGIALTQLRHATSWSCIAQANPTIRDANLIHDGQVLLIPTSCLP
jgi:nucleoid-associated protein YgaU